MYGLTRNQAIKSSSLIMVILLFFHVGIILSTALVDVDLTSYIWGGRITSTHKLIQFEIGSILILSFMLWMIRIQQSQITVTFLSKLSNVSIWLFLVLFTLNTVGNILAISSFEKGFAIITLYLAYCMFVISTSTSK